MSSPYKCPYCKAASWKRKTSGGPVACQACSRILEECHTDVQGLFVELLHDVPLCVVTPDLSEKRETQRAVLASKDVSSTTNGFMTAFSTASLELSPLFTTTSSSISGHLAELERLLGDNLYSLGEGPCSPSTTDILRAYFQILEVASILGLERERADHAVHLFRKCIAANSLRNRNVEALATACLVHAMREAQEPRTLQKVAAAAGLPQKEVGKHLKVLADVLKLSQPVNSNSIAVHLPRFCSALQLDKTTQDLAAHVGEVVISKSFCTRRNPISISAAAIYLSCQLEDKRKTQTEICKATGLTEVTLRKVYKELLENLDDLLPPNYMPPVPLERAFPVTAAALGRVNASRNASPNFPLSTPPDPHAALPTCAGVACTPPSQIPPHLPHPPRHRSSLQLNSPRLNRPHTPASRRRDLELGGAGSRFIAKGTETGACSSTPLTTAQSDEETAFMKRGQGALRNGRTSHSGIPTGSATAPMPARISEADGGSARRKGGEVEREGRPGDAHEAEERRRARERDRATKEQEAARDWSEHEDRCREINGGPARPSPSAQPRGRPPFENTFFPYQHMGVPRMLGDPRLAPFWAAANHHRMFGGFHPAAVSAPLSTEAVQAVQGQGCVGGVGVLPHRQGTQQDMGTSTSKAASTATASGSQSSVVAASTGGQVSRENAAPFPWLGPPPSGLAGSSEGNHDRERASGGDRAESSGREDGGQQQSEKPGGQAGRVDGHGAERPAETQGHMPQDNTADPWARFQGGQGSCPPGGEAMGMHPGFVPAFQGFPPAFWQMVVGSGGRFPMFPPPFLPPAFARSTDGGECARRDGGVDDKGEESGRSGGGTRSQAPLSPMMLPPMAFPPHLFIPPGPRPEVGEGAGSGDKGRPENGSVQESNRGCENGPGAGFRRMDLHPMLGMSLGMALQHMYGAHMGAMVRPSPLKEGSRVAEVGGESAAAAEHKPPP